MLAIGSVSKRSVTVQYWAEILLARRLLVVAPRSVIQLIVLSQSMDSPSSLIAAQNLHIQPGRSRYAEGGRAMMGVACVIFSSFSCTPPRRSSEEKEEEVTKNKQKSPSSFYPR